MLSTNTHLPIRNLENDCNEMTPAEVTAWLDRRDQQIRRRQFLRVAIFLAVAALVLAACALHADCIALHWARGSGPTPTTVELLADTQNPADRAEIRAWFKAGETGFVLASSHTNAIAAAIHDGATAKTIHHAKSVIWDTVNFGEKM